MKSWTINVTEFIFGWVMLSL